MQILSTNTHHLVRKEPPLLRVVDEDGWRWYHLPDDGDRPENWFASVTNILTVAVPESLRNYFIETGLLQQKRRLVYTSDAGREIHEMIERDLDGEDCSREYPALGSTYGKWLELKKKHGIQAYAMEVPVFSRKFGYAGTLDILGEFDGRPVIMDIKTGWYSVKSGWQMAAYKQAYEEMQNGNVQSLGMVGLSIKRDGSLAQPFVYSHHDYCWRAFLACFTVWKALYFRKLHRMNWRYLHDERKTSEFAGW